MERQRAAMRDAERPRTRQREPWSIQGRVRKFTDEAKVQDLGERQASVATILADMYMAVSVRAALSSRQADRNSSRGRVGPTMRWEEQRHWHLPSTIALPPLPPLRRFLERQAQGSPSAQLTESYAHTSALAGLSPFSSDYPFAQFPRPPSTPGGGSVSARQISSRSSTRQLASRSSTRNLPSSARPSTQRLSTPMQATPFAFSAAPAPRGLSSRSSIGIGPMDADATGYRLVGGGRQLAPTNTIPTGPMATGSLMDELDSHPATRHGDDAIGGWYPRHGIGPHVVGA